MRPAIFAMIALVLLHQLVAGIFAGGTVLCVGSSNGIALQPVGLTCCTSPSSHPTVVACCADDASAAQGCPASKLIDGCDGCTDHELAAADTLRPQIDQIALPMPLPAVVAWIHWPPITASPYRADVRRTDRSPPPLSFLSTVILRC